jgi:GNAT superfamily N-acetyltransferase
MECHPQSQAETGTGHNSMRAIEFEGIRPISASNFRGGKKSLVIPRNFKNTPTQLPGGSGFVYTVTSGAYGYSAEISIWDPKGPDYINAATSKPVKGPRETYWAYLDRVESWNNSKITPGQLIGNLEISPAVWFPLPNAVEVGVITVDEDYRGRGIATALYGIVLTIMKRPLVAGNSQTPGGQRNWVSLAGIPGVEMKGYVGIEDYNLYPNPKNSRGYQGTEEQAEKNIDTIMGKLGGDYIGQSQQRDEFSLRQYFAFDVRPNTTGQQLEAYVKTQLSKIYGDTEFTSGLYATWSGT